MKKVKVLNLGEPLMVMMAHGSDTYSAMRYVSDMGMNPAVVGVENSSDYHSAVVSNPSYQRIDYKIHCLKHAVKGDWARSNPGFDFSGYRLDQLSDTWVKTQYIAMEPELFKMLDIVVRQPYEERERVRAARLQDAHNRIEEHKRIINNFWALPWYKRVWFAITKDC